MTVLLVSRSKLEEYIMKKILIFALISLFRFTVCAESLPSPYSEIKLRPFFCRDLCLNKAELTKLILKEKVRTVVEIGSYHGSSTIKMAEILPQDGVIYAVDHFQGNENSRNRPPLNQDTPFLYEQFLSNIIHKNLTHKVIPMRMTSLEAAAIFQNRNEKIDLVYVDGDHEEESVYQDLTAWFPLIKGHGIICGDDWEGGNSPKHRPIKNAVNRFCKENNLRVSTNGWFWRLYE